VKGVKNDTEVAGPVGVVCDHCLLCHSRRHMASYIGQSKDGSRLLNMLWQVTKASTSRDGQPAA
jgi:hypothetical protein